MKKGLLTGSQALWFVPGLCWPSSGLQVYLMLVLWRAGRATAGALPVLGPSGTQSLLRTPEFGVSCPLPSSQDGEVETDAR